MNRGDDAVFGRAMKTYSKAGRIHKVPAAAYWPLDVNRQQLFDSSGGSAMAANSPPTNPQPMEETSRKKSTVGSRRKRTAKKAVVSLKENCEPSEEPARGKTNSVGSRRVRATKRQALENKTESVVLPRPAKFVTTRRGAARPIASIPLQNLDSSDEFVLGKEVSKGQKSHGCKARVTFSPESSVNDTVQSDGRSAIRRVGQQSSISEAEDQTFDTFQTRKPLFCSTPALQLAGKRRGIAAAAPPVSPLDLSAAEDLVSPGDHFSPPLSVPLKEPSSGSKTVLITTEAPDRHGISSVLLFSVVSDAVSSYRSVSREAEMLTDALKDECLSRRCQVQLERVDKLLLQTPYGSCLGYSSSYLCPQITEEPQLVASGSLCVLVEPSVTDIHSSSLAHSVEPSVTVSDIHTSSLAHSEPSVTVSDGSCVVLVHTGSLAHSEHSGTDIHTSICVNSVEPSVTVSDIHTSICANSVEPSVTVSDIHSSSLANSFVPSVADVHTGSLAHSVECNMSVASDQSANQVDDNIDGVTDAWPVENGSCVLDQQQFHKEVPEEEAEVIIARLKEECLTKTSTVPLERLVLTQWTGAHGHGMHPDRLSVEPSESVIDVHIGSLAHSLQPSVTDIHTCNLAHSVECDQSVASVQPAHQVNDGSCIVVDWQQFNEEVPENKAAMIIARLKEECLTKTSTVPLKRLVLTQWTGAHSMHSEDTASEKVTCSEDVSADAKDCVQDPNECRPKKISRATKETKRQSVSKDRPGTARKAFVSGLSVSRWRDGGSAKADRFQRGRSNAGDGSIIGYNASKVFNDGLLHGTGICSTPVRALPGNLDLSSLLADLRTPETHTWSRLKARLSVHRRVTVRMTPRRLQSPVLESSARAGLFDRSMDLFDMTGRTPLSKRLQSRLQNSVLPHQSISEGLEDDLTDAEKVYAECNQQGPLCWEECIVPERLKRCKKIGEGTFGEVFSTINASGDTVALKVIPIEGKEKVNGEEQKTFGDILHEMIISKELSGLKEKPQNQTYGFIGLHGLHCVKGSYPAVMLKAWDAFDRQKGSENDRPDFENEQLFLILEFEFGGSDLENSNGKLSSLAVAKSILHQVAAALAVAERQLCFEHRDLHWGNILVRATKEKSTSFLLDGIKHSLDTNGVLVRIIDYSLSRMEIDGLTVACDISEDEELFMGQGDYQFDIYRLMREENSNKWDDYQPHSNVLWLHYLCDKLLSMQYRSKGGSRAKDTRKELKHIHDNLLQCRSANEALQSGLF